MEKDLKISLYFLFLKNFNKSLQFTNLSRISKQNKGTVI